ncbi:hypothetical protein GCM10007049_08410 [Echinicola pacifica]|uniref:Carboxymuconolactone decarboxylase-like domain-containing protein n=2 Tax=Echinicola pacifica TaxID=346377 RepID=A0A918PPT8_9BACT|nr:carboxymuconolactone decarboxylase family protein [Echinicola pacifica]GGZ18523.1 hypothetical protein GCM10007049_08410 [Echinicola pacifica]
MRMFKIIAVLLLCNVCYRSQAQQLDKGQISMASIAALTTISDWEGLRSELSKGLDNGLTVNQIKEQLVHLYAYVGFPKSIMGLQTFLSVLEERKADGVNDNWGKEASPIDDTLPKYGRGKKVLEELIKNPLPETKPAYQQFSSEIDRFLKEHLFADIFERDVLTYQQRELTTISALIVMGDVEPMLRGHMRIGLKQGFTKGQLNVLVESLRPYLDEKKMKSAKIIISELH